jgi:hypothetical protein
MPESEIESESERRKIPHLDDNLKASDGINGWFFTFLHPPFNHESFRA